MSVYKIEQLANHEIDQLVPLMFDCFGMQVVPEYFIWKYLNNPVSGTAGFVAKDNEGKIVAFEGLMPELYSIGNGKKVFFHSTDTMTHPLHRRKGLYQKIANAGFEFLRQQNNLFEFGFGGPMSTPLILKLGWKTLFDVPFYFKTHLQSLLNISVHFKIKGIEVIIKEIKNVEEIIPIIHKNQTNNIYKIINKEILVWKISNPRFNYSTFGIYDDKNNLAAYVIFYIQNNKIMLFDFGFSESERNFERLFFAWLDKEVIRNKYNAIVTFSQSNTMFSQTLKRNGYISNKLGFGPLSYRLPFMVYTEEKTYNLVNNPQNWTVSPIYHDSF
jgi:hypothetical protein